MTYSAAALLAAAAWLGSLAGPVQDLTDASPEASGDPTVLHFVTWKPDHPRVWEEAIARFTAAHPHIQVIREIAPHSSTAYHDLLSQKLKNQDPTVDLFFMDVIWAPEFAAAGWVLPLEGFFPASAQAAFIPATIEAGTYGGHLYGVPSRIDVGMLYYRTDLLAKYGFRPPRTWDDLVHQANTIVEGEVGGQPLLRGYSGQFKQYEGLVCNMLEFIGSYGGRLLTADGQRATLSRPETLEPVRFVRDRIIRRLATRAVLTYQESESLNLFIQGNAVFHRNWPYAWEIANNPSRSAIAGKAGVAALPTFPQGPTTSALGGWLYGLSAYSRHPEAAWQFIEFLSSEPMQKFFAVRAGLAPSRLSLFQDSDVLAANPQFGEQAAVFRAAVARPRTPLYPAVSHVLQRYFSRALAFWDLDLEAEAASADRQINDLLTLTRARR
ncbi:MAG: ABC transporter substrate-binding protein [Nitrospirales bacterium]